MNDPITYFEHKDDLVECVVSWDNFLDAFKEVLAPVAARYGLSFGEALIAYKLNQVCNGLSEISDDPF
jgi:hypothetical protein